MAKRHILVIEDDAAIRRVVLDALKLEGFETSSSATFADGLEAGLRVPCHLIVLDLVLPGGSGLTLLEEVRFARPTMPVVIVTAKGREDDRVGGLKLGADDYLVKPFSVRELVARVEAVLRRSAERPLDVHNVVFRGGSADLARAIVSLDSGATAELAEREVALLRYLAMNRGRTVSRDELLERVWRLPASRVRTRTVDMHVARLRDKLGDRADRPLLIQTVRGKGYCFVGDLD
jgi:DNA-binding response OmpR family regulator